MQFMVKVQVRLGYVKVPWIEEAFDSRNRLPSTALDPEYLPSIVTAWTAFRTAVRTAGFAGTAGTTGTAETTRTAWCYTSTRST